MNQLLDFNRLIICGKSKIPTHKIIGKNNALFKDVKYYRYISPSKIIKE